MTSSETAQFIKDRALTLRYEGSHFRTTTEVALAWLRNASAWAQTHGHRHLSINLSHQMREMREALQ